MKYIFVDGSYFIFFRYHALANWWSLAHKDEVLVANENEDFKDKFRKTVVEKLKEIPKKVGIKKMVPYKMFVGVDCSHDNIWRTPLTTDYKGGRADSTMQGHFFKLTYDEKLFETTIGSQCLLYHPHLEADDVIALSVRHILATQPDAECYVITSDMDYIQLADDPRVKLFDLKYKQLTEKSKYFQQSGSPDKDMLVKYLCGDKSDNLPAAFPKCGKKTAEKIADMSEEERHALLEAKKGLQQFEHNFRLMNFTMIPRDLKEEFLYQHQDLLSPPSSQI